VAEKNILVFGVQTGINCCQEQEMSRERGQIREEILWRRKTSLFWGANREKLLPGARNVPEKGRSWRECCGGEKHPGFGGKTGRKLTVFS
jgi:hypothetical protein